MIVATITLAALFAVPYFTKPAVVGKWHITKVTALNSNGVAVSNETADMYWVFNSSGTGYATGGDLGFSKFNWKDLGNNIIEINPENSSYSIRMNYQTSGDSITFTMQIQGITVELYGERVNEVPHSVAQINS